LNPHIDEYSKNKFTLKYQNKSTEILYLDSIFEFKNIQMLFIMILTLVLYVLYTAFDFFLLTELEQSFAVPFHISMIMLWMYLIPAFYYNKFRKFATFILYLMPIYAVMGTSVFAYYYNSVYIIDIYVILFWSFVAIGYMFLESVIISSVMAIISAVILYTFNVIDFKSYMLHLFVMTAAWTLGLSASYIIELYSRKNYEKKVKITHMKNKLKEQASRDYLTNLYNRRYFNEVARDIIKIANREKKEYSIIMLDIDRFKNINDTYGHAVGDDVIRFLASLLVKHTRDSDIVSRFGGEEFAILLPFTDKDGAYKIAEDLRLIVQNQKVKLDNENFIQFTISLGVDNAKSEDKDSISYLLDRADKALYKAKDSGRNMVVVN